MRVRSIAADLFCSLSDKKIDYRLDGQHIYMKKFAYDDRLVYDRNVELQAGSSVLDSGTGTGALLSHGTSPNNAQERD